jgi:hypothetical protein
MGAADCSVAEHSVRPTSDTLFVLQSAAQVAPWVRMGTTRLIALVPALIVAVISQTGSNQLGACLLVVHSVAPFLFLVGDSRAPAILASS